MSQPEHNAPFHGDANQLPAGLQPEVVGASPARDGFEVRSESGREQGSLLRADGHAAPPVPNGTDDTARLRPALLLPAGVKLLGIMGLGARLI